jgi:hypothetical protein
MLPASSPLTDLAVVPHTPGSQDGGRVYTAILDRDYGIAPGGRDPWTTRYRSFGQSTEGYNNKTQEMIFDLLLRRQPEPLKSCQKLQQVVEGWGDNGPEHIHPE